jgi:membrane dipeptidase
MNRLHLSFTRRKFIVTMMINPLSPWTVFEQDPRVKDIVEKSIGIDTHNHMDLPFNASEFKNQQYNLATEMNSSGLTAICMTFCVDRPSLTKEGEA